MRRGGFSNSLRLERIGAWPHGTLDQGVTAIRRVAPDTTARTWQAAAATQYQMGVVYALLGEENLAFDCLNQALQIQTTILGNDNPATLRTRQEIGKMHASYESNLDEAFKIFNAVLETQQRIHGKKHPNIADTLHSIGCAYQKKGDFANALRILEECYYMRLEFLGWDHPLQATTLYEITKIHMSRGHVKKASHICDVVLHIGGCRTRPFGQTSS